MIKFFRKIRQKLLSENKFSKYLIYGIGEIILVVIGILIALQINNWNQNSERAEKEQYYLRTLKIDLENQLNSIDSHLEFLQKEISVLDTIRTSFREIGSFTEIDNFNNMLFELIGLDDFEIHVNTLKELNSTGQIALIHNDKLRSTIVSTFQDIIEVENRIKSNYNKVYYPNVFPVVSGLVDFRYPDNLSIALNNKLNSIDKQLELSKSMILDLLILKASENQLAKLKPNVTELISLIELEINKK